MQVACLACAKLQGAHHNEAPGEGEPDIHHDEAPDDEAPGQGEPPGSRGGLPCKNLSGTAAAASSAPPPMLFKLHLNPSDFLGWTMQGKIHTYLKT